MIERVCRTCALYDQERGGCLRTQLKQSPTDSCSSWILTVPTCEICGQMFIPPKTYVIEGEHIIKSCPACAGALSTCRTCAYGNNCDFQTNPINIPPVVQKTVRQGNMTMTTTVPNPERIKATCAANCGCWDKNDKACNKTCGTCGKYKPSYLP